MYYTGTTTLPTKDTPWEKIFNVSLTSKTIINLESFVDLHIK